MHQVLTLSRFRKSAHFDKPSNNFPRVHLLLAERLHFIHCNSQIGLVINFQLFFSSSQVVAEHLEAFSAVFHKYVPLVKGEPAVIVEIIPTAEGKDSV